MIAFDKEKETLLIPLYGKALESRKKAPILFDAKALEIVEQIDYDFAALGTPGKTNTLLCLRAKLIDNFTGAFLDRHPDSVVLHLGCGLDSRYQRIGNFTADWYDLDYPEVIDLHRRFFPETERYHLIASSVTATEWLAQIPTAVDHCLVIAEGLFMYLREAELKALLSAIKERVGRCTLIFDAYSTYTAKKVGRHPALIKTGAEVQWGIDDPLELSGWDTGINFLREITFTANEELRNLGWGTRLAYKLANLFPAARRAQRILVYEIG